VRDAIHRNQIYVCSTAAQQIHQCGGIFWAVVDAINHRHLEGSSSPCHARVCCCGSDHFLNGPLAIQWHKKVAQSVTGGV